MKRRMLPFLCLTVFLSTLTGVARAENDFLSSQFLETPLLILTALIVVDVIAFIYHKIRK
ncbi:MAG: hypothetical protein ACP5IM_06285 [Candidatus Bathyarchaeia archaeon]|nr:MAG: hypothetical protein C0195_01710 [Candidatus Bathyarchaeota archaeon]